MSSQTRGSTDRSSVKKARESVEKAAFAAVGAPIAAVKALGARISDLRDAVRSSSRDMSDDLTREMDEWIAEGEKVIERAMKRLRESGVVDEVRSKATAAREAAEVGIDKATGGFDRQLDVLVPDADLTIISGVGPGYAKQMHEAGIAGISEFLAKTATSRQVEELAEATGVSATTLESWRSQVELTRVEGIGESYASLLHRAGIWTLPQLAEADVELLAAELSSIDMPDVPEHRPSPETVEEWSREAKRLS